MIFDKLLVANRGEIACRVIRTARRMGLRTVAVYSEADAGALHVELADEAVLIGPAAARESYLRIDRLIDAARRSGAGAVHPGYGFLSENADFAEACAEAGLVFVGPPPAAIRAMGSKAAAKALMEKAGVPLVPGYHGAAQGEAALLAEAKRIGFPVLIKASAGGGGKGMRVVEREAEFSAALASAKREAAAAFGDDRVLVEKYLRQPRHIEMQVMADRHGNVLHLFERDCSLQRRHQKVIEEAPAPGLTAEQRRVMGEAAVAAARAVGYEGAGTVEFIAEGERFYFMEMNTRLQVEHPVTEMITGLDLVEWQLRVAAGERLPWRQETLQPRGHAIEARVYAEDPVRDFLPATGRLTRLRAPREDEIHVRVDTGVREGDEVGIHYDPMIAKLVVWDESRDAALRRLRAALAAYEIAGVTTNLGFLARIAAHPAFATGEIDTDFIARHRPALVPPASPPSDEIVAGAALALLVEQEEESRAEASRSGDPWSPWHQRNGWRLNGDTYQDLRFEDGSGERSVRVHYRRGAYELEIGGRRLSARAERSRDGRLAVELGGARSRLAAVRHGREITILANGESWRLVHLDPLAPELEEDASAGRLTAPMPGRVLEVLVAVGARVARGQPLVVLEAMKMEHTIAAPADGVVARVAYAAGDLVEEGATLIAFEEGNDAAA